MRAVVIRASLVLLSVVVIAWSVVLVRDQRILAVSSAELLGNTALSDAAFRLEARRLEEAGTLNPDTSWRYSRAVAWIERDPRRAASYFEDLLADEPENVAAWRLLALTTEEIDPRRSREAEERARRLDPLGGG